MRFRFQNSLTGIGLCLIAAPLAAQQPDSASLPRVVVTATRVDAPLGADILTVTVLSRETLQRSGAMDLSDALRLVPGVAIARTAGRGSLASLFLRGGESDYVRVLVDGVPVNDAGGAVDLAWLSLDDVDRVEVVRGPASVLYGSDAVTGVVQIFTRDGSGAQALDVAAEAGRYGTTRMSASLGGGGAVAGYFVAASRERSDGLLSLNNDYRQDVFSWKGRIAPVAATSFGLSARHHADEYHYPHDDSGRPVDRNALLDNERSLLSGHVTQLLGSRLRAVLGLSAFRARARNEDLPDGPADTLGFYAFRSDGTMHRRTAEAQLHFMLSGASVITAGTEWMRETQASVDSSNFDVAENAFDAERTNRAVYAQWLAQPGRLSLSLGWRYDDNDAFGIFRTLRAGVAYRAWRGGLLRASAGNAFRSPTFFESFDSPFTLGNPELDPERTRSWEIGIAQEAFGGRFHLAATWFDQRFRDLIQYTFQAPGQPNYFNVAAASARGLEIEASGMVARAVRASLNTTLLRTNVENPGFASGAGASFVHGHRLLRRPSHASSLTISTTATAHTTLDVVARVIGPRDDRDFSTFPATPVVLPAHNRFDVRLSRNISGAVTMALGTFVALENVFGVRYEEIAGFPAPGRVLRVGLSLRAQP